MLSGEFGNRLKVVVMSTPHLRFGQLVDNALTEQGRSLSDLFYLTDKELIEILEEYVEKL